jgi:hypothetical protein
MKRIVYYLFLLQFMLFLNGCNDNPIENSSQNRIKIKKVIVSDDFYTEYFYDSNLLIKKELVARDELMTSNAFTYNDDGKLIRKDNISKASGVLLTSYLTYEYSDNDILLRENAFPKINDVFEFRGYTLYEYEANRLVKHSFYNLKNELRNYHILKYEGENIVEDYHYDSDNKLQFHEIFEYDNNPNPLINDKSLASAFTLSENNVVKWTNKFYTVDPPNVYVSESTYSYDTYGYPIKCVTKYQRNAFGTTSESTSSSNYEYY